METKNLSFIFVQALLSETGEFELQRGYEVYSIPSSSSHFAGDDHVLFVQLDNQGKTIYSEKVKVIFYDGCDPKSQKVAIATITKAIPLYSKAVRLSVVYNDAEVYSGQIGVSKPALSDLKVSIADDEAVLSFQSNVLHEDLVVYAKTKDNRLLRPRSEFVDNNIRVDLNLLKGLEEVYFIVEATKDFRTSQLTSHPISVPEAATKGSIIEPANNSTWPFGKRGSFIASIFDETGRHLQWDNNQFSWSINGKSFGNNDQITGWSAETEGEFRIQLHKINDSGQSEILAEANVIVPPPNESQKEYYRLIKQLN